MRLIDADALKWMISHNVYKVRDRFGSEDYGMFWTGGIEMIIDAAQTIDAVPVVRCKDCTEYEPDEDGDPGGCCTNTAFWMPEDGYCSDGERKAEP